MKQQNQSTLKPQPQIKLEEGLQDVQDVIESLTEEQIRELQRSLDRIGDVKNVTKANDIQFVKNEKKPF